MSLDPDRATVESASQRSVAPPREHAAPSEDAAPREATPPGEDAAPREVTPQGEDAPPSEAPPGDAPIASRSPRPERGQELDLRVESLAFGGDGVARIPEGKADPGGYVVFVSGAVSGDRVRAVVTRRKRAYAHARTVEVLEPSTERVAPLAQHPGAPWQVLRYERQLEVKRAQVDEALRRLGGLGGFVLEDTVPALEQWRYRNKLEYSFGTDDKGELVCGFHAPGSWERIEPMRDCLLASELGNAARLAVLEWCRGQGLPARDRRGGATRGGPAALRNLVVREGRRTGRLQVRLVTTPGELDAGNLRERLASAVGERSLSGLLWTRTTQLGETTAGGETELIAGEARLEERIGDLDLRISPEAFFQTNTEMAEVLYRVAGEYAALEGWERVYDLYCGIGTMGLTLATRAGQLWGLELVEDAVADAIANARRNDITNARFFAADARHALPELVARAGRPDVVLVDPPRAGLSQRVVRRIIDAAPRRIVYVSCNPTTLAPNAAQLAAAGWSLRRVRPVDMFPQTPHIECVALLDRAD
jgi:23S rRNA (uracil1939-C5)-methyltransferase